MALILASRAPVRALRNATMMISALRPDYSLILGRDGTQAPVNELLHALSFVGLGRVDIPLRVSGNAVHGEELAGLSAAIAKTGQDLE